MNQKNLYILLIVLFFVSGFADAALDMRSERSIESSLQQVESHYLNKNWDEAIRLSREVLREAPEQHPVARRAHDLIVLSLQKKNEQKLADEREREQEINALRAHKYLQEGQLAVEDKNYSAAIRQFQRALQIDSRNAGAYFFLGFSQLQKGNEQSAFNSFRRCLRLDPNHSRALFHITGLSFKHGSDLETLDYSQRLVKVLDNRIDELKNKLRTRNLHQSRVAEIAADLKSLKKNLAQALFLKGILSERRELYDQAAESLRRTINLNSGSADAWFHYGRVQLSRERYHQASTALRHAASINEAELQQKRIATRELLRKDALDEAVQAELEMRKLAKKTATVFLTLSIVNNRMNQHAIAMNNIEKSLELDPDNLRARYSRAIMLAERNRFEDALEQIREILKEAEPESEIARRSVKTVKFLTERIIARDNPDLVRAIMERDVEIVEVDEYLKNKPEFGGRRAEAEVEEAFTRLREVAKLIQTRNYPEAVRRLLYLRSRHPQIADVRAVLGHCYLRMGRLADAKKAFEEAVGLNSRHAEALNSLAYIKATRNENLPKAWQYIQKAMRLGQMRPEFYHTAGWVQFKMGEVAKSIEFFEKAIELRPDYARAYYNIGLGSYILQNFDRAVAAFEQVLRIDSDHHKAMLFKSIALARLNKGDESIEALENLKRMLKPESTLKKVVVDLHEKIKLAHERHQPLPVPEISSPAPIAEIMKEAAKYRSQGLVNRAEDLYLEAARLAPERFEPHYELGMMHAMSGLNRPALASLEKALELNPDDYETRLNKGKILHKVGRKEEARKHLNKALTLNESDPESRYYLGLIAYQEERFESAESHALSALRLNKDFMKAMALLGMSRIRLNRLRPARDIYQELYKKAPADSSIRRHARRQLWLITRKMAPAQAPSIENVTEVKEQMVQRIHQQPEVELDSEDSDRIEGFGAGSMTENDRLWVLRTLDNFKERPSYSPVRVPQQKRISLEDGEWMLRRVRTFDPQAGRFALPPDISQQRFGIEATEPEYEREPDEADDIILEALSLAERGFMNQALEKLQEAAKISPNNLDLLLNQGYLNTLSGNFRFAFEAYSQAIKYHPDEPLARLGLGNLYWLGGKAEEAANQWRQIDSIMSPDEEFNFLSRAVKIWLRMLEINPVDADAHSNLGLAYMFSGEFVKALTHFEAVVNLEEGRFEHKFYIAQVHSALYILNKTATNRQKAQQMLNKLRAGPRPFPYSDTLSRFVSSL